MMETLKPRTIEDVLHDFAKDVLSMNRNWFAESPDEIHIPDGAKYAAELREMIGRTDERTCRNAEESDPDFWFKCSECRHVMAKEYSRYFSTPLNYCPKCGAKVVG